MKQLVLYLSFWGKCAKEAAAGLFDKANALAALLGTAILFFGLRILGKNWQGPTDAIGSIGFSLVSILAATLISAALIFAWRLFGAPARLYAIAEAAIPLAPASDIALTLLYGLAYQAGLKDIEGQDLPPCMVFSVRAENRGTRYLQNCQIGFGAKEQVPHAVSGPFSLRSGEAKNIPVIRVQIGADPRAIAYIIDTATGAILANGPA